MSEEATLNDFTEDTSIDSDKIRSSLDETSLGNIPADWQAVRIKDVVHDSNYGASESSEDYDPKKPRYVRITDINAQGRLKSDTKVSLSEEKSNGYLLREGDLVFARSGASVGKTYLHRNQNKDCAYAGYLIRQNINENLLNPEFLYQYTNSNRYNYWVDRIQRTGAQPNINAQEYGNLLIPYPSLSEQRKIATVLYTIDQAIEKTKEIVDQVSRLKSGIVQDIFSEGYNHGTSQSEWFGPVPSEWDVLRLGDLADVTKLAGYEYTNDFDYNEEGEIIALRALNLKGNRLNLDNELKYITRDNAEELDRSKLSEGDVAMTYVGAYIGESGYIPKSDKFTLGPNVAKMSPNEQLMGEYLHQALQTKQLKTQIKARQSSTGQPALSMSKIRKLEIPLPSLDEQQQIVTLLKDFDRQYMHENGVIDQYQRLKKGLMQDLLSGTVRTTDTNITVPDEVAQHG